MIEVEKYRSYLRYEKNYSSHTEISYLTDLLQFKKFVQEVYSISDLSHVRIDIVRDWVVSLMKNKVAAASVCRKLSSLKSFYLFLQKTGSIDVSPLKKITGPKIKKKLPSFLNHDDIKKILDCEMEPNFTEIRNRVIIELFYVTGIRRSELIGLKDRDVDLSQGFVKVLGKRNKERIVPIANKTCNLLKFYMEVRAREINIQDDSFFVTEKGKSMYPMLVYRVVNSSLRLIPNLAKASPHVLRHSFATGMLNNSADLNSVKEILGHASLASTQIYTHTSFKELEKVYNQAHPRA